MGKASLQPAVMAATPSEAVVRAAGEIKFETDGLGRRLGVARPGALLRHRLYKVLGPKSSANERLVGEAMLVFCVRSIDGNDVQTPNSEPQYEHLLGRLDNVGLAAVAKCLVDQFELGDRADVEDQVKN